MGMEPGAGEAAAHDAEVMVVETGDVGGLTAEDLAIYAERQAAAEREVAEAAVAGARRKVEKAQVDLAAAEAALAEAEAALAATGG